MVIAPHPRRLGFDDGVILPPEEFPANASPALVRGAAAERAPLRGTVRVIVILVDFADKPMTQPASHYQDLFFSSGVLPHGSVKEYFSEVTNGLVTLAGEVVGPYRMPSSLAWYANSNYGIGKGGGDFRSPQLARDAAEAADPSVNFGPYDNDGNGYVDAFIVIHAGRGAEQTGSNGDIWSHKATLDSVYATDSTRIYGYLTVPEDARIGVCAHELGHLLFGFPDLYDTDYSSEGIGNWCLMAGGTWNAGGDIPAHPSAWCKVNQGWASVTNVTANGPATIPDVKGSRNVLRLWKDGAGGPEYFLVENRQKTGFDSALPGDGLLVWHIDENQSGNTNESHYKVALLESDAQRHLENNVNPGDGGDPYPGDRGVHAVTGSTSPSTRSYANQPTCVSITDISASGPTMTASLRVRCGKDVQKDRKDLKDRKEQLKEQKERAKEGLKELKEHKEGKELPKEIKDSKEHKERLKDVKEREKLIKEIDIKQRDNRFDRWELEGGGDWGLEGEPFVSQGVAGAQLDALEARIAALETAMTGSPSAAPAPFIDAALRPDLTGAAPSAEEAQLGLRMARGDRDAKRAFDAPPATTPWQRGRRS